MNKVFFTIIITLSFLQLYAQTEKNYLLRTNFNYFYNHKDNLDAGNGMIPQEGVYGVKTNNLSFAITSARKFKTSFYYGLGFSYNLAKEEINPNSDVSAALVSGYSSNIIIQKTITCSQTYSPLIFIQYDNSLSDRFSVAIELYSKYDFSNFKTSSTLTNGLSGYNNISEKFQKKQYVNIGLHPSVRFDIMKNMGTELTLGLFEYSHKFKDSRMFDDSKKTSSFQIGFKPENWLLGFYLRI
jgi:hypothetical protein